MSNFDLVQWKDVPKTNGLYRCSNYGECIFLGRKYIKSDGKPHTHSPYVLKSWEDVDGYLNYDMMIDSIKIRWKAHRLVSMLFVDGYSEDLEINHYDLNKENNFYKNLIPSTKKENIAHAVMNGRHDNNLNHMKQKVWRQKNITIQYGLNGVFIKEYESLSCAASALKGSKSMISRAIIGRSKTAYGFKWAYKK